MDALNQPFPPSPRSIVQHGLMTLALFVVVRAWVAHLAPLISQAEVHESMWISHDWMMVLPNLAVAGYLYALGRRRWSHRSLSNYPGRLGLCVGLCLGVLASCAYSWADQVQGPMDPKHDAVRVAALGLGLAVAVAEETAFRGVLFKAVEELKGTAWAVWTSAIAFTILHLGERICAASPRTAMGGLALSIARAKGLSVAQLIAVHFIVEAAWALFLPQATALDSPRELTSAAAIALGCLILWKWVPDPKNAEA